MASKATPGEMRTAIRILSPTYHEDDEGYKNPSYVNIYPDGRSIRCKWTSAFGSEAVQAYSLGLTDTATLTLRYDPHITAECVIAVGTDKAQRYYELMSPPNDVGGAHRWLELKVKRRVRGL